MAGNRPAETVVPTFATPLELQSTKEFDSTATRQSRNQKEA